MKWLIFVGFSMSLAAALWGWNFLFPPLEIPVNIGAEVLGLVKPAAGKTEEERIAEAMERSANIKGLYMTADVANDQGAAGTRLRKNLISLAETTEINGLVIDVKEVCGPDYNEGNLKKLLGELKEKNIWAIARIVVFKDASQIEVHPEWYLKRANEKSVGNECWNKKHLRAKPDNDQLSIINNQFLWRDRRGGYWLDPASPEAQKYILEFSRKIIDLGFDELQFDYIRFPSDGDVENATYAAWDRKTPKYLVLKSFFDSLHKNLKAHKPEIILSADLFGYAAIGAGDVGIGQRLEDIGDNFDYISFMVYPSHYYHGLYLPADPGRGLPVVDFSETVVRNYPGTVVERSLLLARDFLDGKMDIPDVATSASTTTMATEEPKPRSKVLLRPWLEDFFHEEDKAAGRPWGVEKVRAQIEAAEKVEPHGWLLWNAANIYTEDALRRE